MKPYFLVWLLSITIPVSSDLSPLEKQTSSGNNNLSSIKEVRIGLLIQGENGVSARQGAELAIQKANGEGGYKDLPFRLMVRESKGPWGAGSKESVNLVFEDEVWAILTSLDGRNAHLAEQVATKGHIVLVSSWATDPTLTQINIPWFFRCVPDDRQQAKTLIREIYQLRKLKKVALIAPKTYDGQMASDTFTKIVQKESYPAPSQVFLETTAPGFQNELQLLGAKNLEAVVLLGPPDPMVKLIQPIRNLQSDPVIFSSLLVLEDKTPSTSDLEGLVVVSPNYWFTSDGKDFQQVFKDIYGHWPGAKAAYAYDGMSLIIDAIRQEGLDREKIKDHLAGLKNFQGITGQIQFDARGNRIDQLWLTEIKNGQPVKLK